MNHRENVVFLLGLTISKADMKIVELRDIIRVIQEYRSDNHAYLNLKDLYFEKSYFAEFFRILVDSGIQNDDEAAKQIYQTPKPGAKYTKLKSSFAASAFNTITFLDPQVRGASKFTQAVFKAYKNLFIISILLRFGSRKGAIALATRTLAISEKYELHHVSIEILEQLRTHAYQIGKKTEFEKYAVRYERTSELLASEARLRTIEQRLRMGPSHSLYIDETLQRPVHDALEKIKTEVNKNDTFNNRLVYFRMQYMYYQFAGSPSKSIAACNEALLFLKRFPHLSPPSRFGEFELYKLENHLLTRDYKRCKEAVLECAKYYKQGSNMWFSYKEEQFLLLMQTTEISEAKNIYSEIIMHPRYDSQPLDYRERWNIFGLYLDYVAIPIKKKPYLLRQNKYRKVIKEFPSYSKDKRGFNVALLVLNILLLLENDKKDILIEQFEALSTYRFTHLHGKNSFESALLFKLIKLMVVNDFDAKKILKKAVPIEIKLANTKPSRGEILEHVQIMPPAWMWQRMKEALLKINGI